MKGKNWLIVTNKWTYTWLVLAILGLLKIPFYDLKSKPVNAMGIVESLLIAAVFSYMFVRMNTYSEFYNPDHPRPKK